MEFVILIIVLILLGEVSFLVVRMQRKLPIGQGSKRKVYVDSSILMDGRILAVAQTGFVGDDLIIPRSVIREMQLLADGKDDEKRARARHGLDVVNELERVVHFDTTILQDELDRTPVDDRLIELAKANRGAIMTNDFNLKKVAETEGVTVLNINELAVALASEYTQGERLTIKITNVGSNPKQGVGSAPDGTMVVVENAKNKVGKKVEVEILRPYQTESGKMLFAKLASGARKKATRKTPNKTK